MGKVIAPVPIRPQPYWPQSRIRQPTPCCVRCVIVTSTAQRSIQWTVKKKQKNTECRISMECAVFGALLELWPQMTGRFRSAQEFDDLEPIPGSIQDHAPPGDSRSTHHEIHVGACMLQ